MNLGDSHSSPSNVKEKKMVRCNTGSIKRNNELSISVGNSSPDSDKINLTQDKNNHKS